MVENGAARRAGRQRRVLPGGTGQTVCSLSAVRRIGDAATDPGPLCSKLVQRAQRPAAFLTSGRGPAMDFANSPRPWRLGSIAEANVKPAVPPAAENSLDPEYGCSSEFGFVPSLPWLHSGLKAEQWLSTYRRNPGVGARLLSRLSVQADKVGKWSLELHARKCN